jgi:hypothetical protein
MRKVGEIDLYEPAKGLVVLEDLFARLELASNFYKPRPNIWNVDAAPIMNFVDQMYEVRDRAGAQMASRYSQVRRALSSTTSQGSASELIAPKTEMVIVNCALRRNIASCISKN